MPLISDAEAASIRQALAIVLVHLYDRTPITTTQIDGDEVSVAGATTIGVACRYEAQGTVRRDATGLVVVSGPSLTVAHDDPLTIGDQVANIRSASGVLLAGSLTVDRRLDDDPLGLTLQKTYLLHGADPGRT